MLVVAMAACFYTQPGALFASEDSLRIEELTGRLREQFRARELDSAWVLVEKIKGIANESGMLLKKADSESNFGLIEMVRGQHISAIAHYRAAAQQYSELGELASSSRLYTQIGQIYLGMQLYDPAHTYFSRSFALRANEKDSLGMANNLINMAGALYLTGKLEHAAADYYQALRIADQLDNMAIKAQILLNLSNIHVKKNEYDTAINHLEHALDLQQQLGDRQGESEVFVNLGIAYYEQGLFDEAERYYLESLAIKEEMGVDIAGIIKVTNNLGVIARERGDHDRAIEYYNEALQMAKQLNDRQTQASVLNNIGTILMLEGKDEALPFLEESLGIATELQLPQQQRINYDNLHQFHAQRGSYEAAYDYLKNYQALNDSLFNVESAARIAELQAIYDTEIKEQENLLLKEQAQVMRTRILMVSISVIATGILAVFFIVLFNLKRKSLRQSRALLHSQAERNSLEKEKAHREQEHLKELLFAEEEITRLQKSELEGKNRELATSAMLILNKNDILNEVRQMAEKSLQGGSREREQCIRQLLGDIERNIDIDEQWQLFKRHFESVHSGFFQLLSDRCPDLTHDELKLCAYLRMNFSSKEIARMLNMAVESVNTKRYRLRKKIKLKNEENLIVFLMQF